MARHDLLARSYDDDEQGAGGLPVWYGTVQTVRSGLDYFETFLRNWGKKSRPTPTTHDPIQDSQISAP
jgi:hypothetical protein